MIFKSPASKADEYRGPARPRTLTPPGRLAQLARSDRRPVPAGGTGRTGIYAGAAATRLRRVPDRREVLVPHAALPPARPRDTPARQVGPGGRPPGRLQYAPPTRGVAGRGRGQGEARAARRRQ